VVTRNKPKVLEKTPDWSPFDAFAVEERLTYADVFRLGAHGLLPIVQDVDGTPWVHRPSLPSWRELLKVHGFKTTVETLASQAEAGHAR
jgi:hypothetical protein